MVSDKAAGEDIQENEVNVIGNWEKEGPCYIAAESETWTTLVILKIEYIFTKLNDLAKNISIQF